MKQNNMMDDLIEKALRGKTDSDRHALTLFSIALASHGKHYIELGVRQGDSTKPLMQAAALNNGMLHSVDIDECPFSFCGSAHWTYHQQDAVEFLRMWEEEKRPSPDFVFIDDWHSADHVEKELTILDRIVTPSTVILVHDTMYGNTCPYYHSDPTLSSGQWAFGGPYAAVAGLNPQFWEFSTLPWSHGLTLLRKKYCNRGTTN